MKALSAAELLTTWEEGLDKPLLEKTLKILAKACAVIDHNDIGLLSIGERDARLLQLREWMFGSRLKNMARCPQCTELTEWESGTADLHLQQLPAELAVRSFLFEKDGFSINFRLPNTLDITHAMSDPEYRNNERKILCDCIVSVNMNGEKYANADLPDEILDALSRRMEAEDPQADISMKIECPACKHMWEIRFDIASYLWAEINNWAQRMMHEICFLARSFGWSEKDILSMSARRRQLYLQMIGL